MEDSRASNADVIVLFNTETMPQILTPIRASRNYSSFCHWRFPLPQNVVRTEDHQNEKERKWERN